MCYTSRAIQQATHLVAVLMLAAPVGHIHHPRAFVRATPLRRTAYGQQSRQNQQKKWKSRSVYQRGSNDGPDAKLNATPSSRLRLILGSTALVATACH